jgi:hypothetical protein
MGAPEAAWRQKGRIIIWNLKLKAAGLSSVVLLVVLCLFAIEVTSCGLQSCVADMEQLAVAWHVIQQLFAASEGTLAGASLGGLSSILTPSTLNRFLNLLTGTPMSVTT